MMSPCLHGRRPRALFVIVLLGLLSAVPARAFEGRHSGDAALFDVAAYQADLDYLASDELEGRGTGQPGIDRAAEYIAGEFQKMGVRPAGDDGTYFQNFKLALQRRIGDATELAYLRNGRRARIPFVLNEDFRPFPFSTSDAIEGDVVFAGYGIVDDETGYDDYTGLDVADKIVLVVRRSPEFAEFDADQHQSFRAKAGRANARGAAAILVVNRPGSADEPLYPFDPATGGFAMRAYGIPMMHLTEAAADALLKAAGKPAIAELCRKIERTKKPASMALDGITVRGRVTIEPVESPVRNVIGLIPGSGPQADEYIVLGAHYDHLGIRHKGEPTFDAARDISNGADDNASGTALVMAMGRAYTRGPAPNRSILLMLFTGEEMGLLGSAHFARHPTVDLSRCVAMLNFDMVGRLKDDKLEVGGMRTGGLEGLVKRLGERYEFVIKDGGGGRGPSDHTSFYNKDIPVLFFFTGIHRQYHKPDDDTHLINYEGAMRIARMAADIVDDIDARDQRPVFSSDTRRAAIARQTDDDDKQQDRKRRRSRNDAAANDVHAKKASPDDEPGTGGVKLGVVVMADDEEPGLPVADVTVGSAAEKAGVKPGDRIVRIGAKEIQSPEDAAGVLASLRIGGTTTLVLVRAGKQVEVSVDFSRDKSPRVRDPEFVAMADQVTTLVERLRKDRNIAVTLKTEVKDTSVQIEIELSDFEATIQMLETLEKMLRDVGDAKVSLETETIWRRGRLSTSIDLEVERESPPAAAAPKAADAHAHAKAGAHGRQDDAETRETMPMVRLGIMPTYGDGEPGVEGYAIDGVIDGGPAATAGMKDGDRIYQIGDRKITNVYEYMDALRDFKPGQEVPVTIIRDGKKIDLKVKATGGRVEPK